MLLTVKQVSAELSVSISTVERLLRSNELKGMRIKECLRIHPNDLDKFIENMRINK